MSVEITEKSPTLADVHFDMIPCSTCLLENITLAEVMKSVAFVELQVSARLLTGSATVEHILVLGSLFTFS